MSRAGYVLVGGKSSRMGRDKALLPLEGEPLARHVASAIGAATGAATLVGDPAVYSGLGYPVIPDLYPGEGPLGGILTALAHSPADHTVVVACDMPGLTTAFMTRLLEFAEAESDAIAIPAGPSGLLEPLCAVYPRAARTRIETAFAAGIRKVTAAFEGIRVATYAVAEVAPFQNVNTPEDWARYAAR